MVRKFKVMDNDYTVDIQKRDTVYSITIKEKKYNIKIIYHDQILILFKINGKKYKSYCAKNAHVWYVHVDGQFYLVHNISGKRFGIEQQSNIPANVGLDVRAPMPGKVLKIYVQKGDNVKIGQDLCVIEAMKMEHVIKAPNDGFVESINCSLTDIVDAGHILIDIKEHPGDETT
ncbi:acetyl-CoA carboxylase biotin carboxyl carrier protein subunit [candidate division KSB1 bacterium]|nr:acetyl-CoA carboxylase biotin carboxyl carrier protein subunit [candidate division KSB1 bacterium]